MFEKVSKHHPDKVADRIAGALVDLAHKKQKNPKIAVEVLIGHGKCHIIAETSAHLDSTAVSGIVARIAGLGDEVDYVEVPQDPELAKNQERGVRCGDNGIFLGVPVTVEEWALADFAHKIDLRFGSDGKYLIDSAAHLLTVCQSHADGVALSRFVDSAGFGEKRGWKVVSNPLGPWTGGPDVDCGATNRKLGSDLAGSATGGGTVGKDLSKADVSANAYCWLKAQETGKPVHGICSIGDDSVLIDGVAVPYADIVAEARGFIECLGGFEALAEYGFVCPKALEYVEARRRGKGAAAEGGIGR